VFGARRNPATPVDRRDEHSPNYYLDWAFDEMKKLVDKLPKSVQERVFVARLAIDLTCRPTPRRRSRTRSANRAASITPTGGGKY